MNEEKVEKVFEGLSPETLELFDKYFGDEEETIGQYYGMHDYDIERIVKNIGRKNKNKDIIDYNHFYCIESDLIIKSNKLVKARKKKKMLLKYLF